MMDITKVSNSTLVTLCVTFVTVLAMVFGLIAMGRDVEPFVAFLGVIITTAIPNAVNLIKTDKVSRQVNTVERNTNGRMSHLVSIIEAQGGTLPDSYNDIERVPVIPQTGTQAAGIVYDYPGAGGPA